jgi:tetratricopeptide (TPR) repeat protein
MSEANGVNGASLANESNEAQLVERYADALRRDAKTPPPPGLDINTAEATRALVLSEGTAALESGQAARMWHRALAQAEPQYEIVMTQNRSQTDAGIIQNMRVLKRDEGFSRAQDDGNSMDESWGSTVPTAPATRPPNSRNLLQYTLTIAAAVLIVALVGGILMDMVNDPIDGYPALVSLNETPTAEPTPVCVSSTDYMTAGEASISTGDYRAALAAYTCAITLDPANYVAYNLRGGLAAAGGDYDQLGYDYYTFITHHAAYPKDDSLLKVLATVRDTIDARPDDPVLYALRGLLLTAVLLDTPTDMPYLLELEPRNPVGYLFSRNWPYKYDINDAYIQKAIELAPDSALLDFWLARGLTKENAAFAKPFFDRAIESNPAHPFAYQARAVADVFLGDMTAAANDFYQHILSNPGTETEIDGLTIGAALPLVTDIGDVSRLPFSADTWQTLNVSTSQKTGRFSPTLIVLNPQGEVMPVPYQITGTENMVSIEGLEIPESGIYTLLVKSNSDTQMDILITEAP